MAERVALTTRALSYSGLYIPPPKMRFCGGGELTISEYVDSANRDADHLIGECGVIEESTVLDIGCGSGRLAIGLLGRCSKLHRYWGIDVHATSIAWCLRWITEYHRNFRFCHVGLQNDRYNPRGTQICSDVQLPFKDGLFDVIALYSVFTHMVGEHVKRYLSEMHRMLKSEGRAMFTVHIGTAGTGDQPGDRLHRVEHTDEFLREALAAARFRVTKTGACMGQEFVDQTVMVVAKK